MQDVSTQHSSSSETLWAACRAVVFGSVIIVVGIMMTVVGYFDVHLSQEIIENKEKGVSEMSINWTKRYLLKSLQYLGPVIMGVGSFILIIACVITLENRDQHTQILRESLEERQLSNRNSLLTTGDGTKARKRTPMTTKEISEWRPHYKAVPISSFDEKPLLCRRRFRSTPCIPHMLESVDIRKLYDRLLCTYYDYAYCTNSGLLDGREHGRACTSDSQQATDSSFRQNVVAEVYDPPPLVDTLTVKAASKSSSSRSSSDFSSYLPNTRVSPTANTNNKPPPAQSDYILLLNGDELPFVESYSSMDGSRSRSSQDNRAYSSTGDIDDIRRAPLATLDVDLRSGSSSPAQFITRTDDAQQKFFV